MSASWAISMPSAPAVNSRASTSRSISSAVDRRPFELRVGHFPASVFGAFAGFDETQEQPLGLDALLRLEAAVDPLGGSGDGRGDRPGVSIGLERQADRRSGDATSRPTRARPAGAPRHGWRLR